MRPAGLGVLYEQFAQLKQKLENEGLFAAGRKRALPAFPKRIGIVTSPQAAALRDVLTTLRAAAAGRAGDPVPRAGAGRRQRGKDCGSHRDSQPARGM